MRMPQLRPDASSVGVQGSMPGNFTKAIYLRSQPAQELERRLGFGPGRLAGGWHLLFALQKPGPDNFEFGGYTHFSGSQIGPPSASNRMSVEQSLKNNFFAEKDLPKTKAHYISLLTLTGPDRLAKVVPVNPGKDYPAGSGVYQCNIPNGVLCKVAAFIGPGQTYLGMYT